MKKYIIYISFLFSNFILAQDPCNNCSLGNTCYYYYWDVDGDGLAGGNYGHKCVSAGQEGNQTATANDGSLENLVTCGANGVSNGTCADSARDIDDMCNGCGGSSACSENTVSLLYDACGVCNGTYNSDIDGDGAVANDSDDCFDDCLGVAQGTATFYYYYLDVDGDGLPGGNYGNKCVAAGQEGNQTASYNGSTVNILTCGSTGVSNGTCADSARDIDDACNGCGGSSTCSENTVSLLYDACGVCNGTYNSDIDGDGAVANDSDDCFDDCLGVAQGTATFYYYYLDVDGDGLPGANYGNKCVALGQEGNQTGSYNGSTVNILTCGSGGVNNGTCADSARDIDDMCNGCGGSSACSENTVDLLYDDCGTCNGTVSDCSLQTDCAGVYGGTATYYYYYWDIDGDGLPGANYGNKCVAAGQEGNQTASYNGSTVNILTCGSGGVSNGTCADSARDIDDACNGCGGSSACSENTEALLYDACGTCNGSYSSDIDGDGTIVFDSDDCFDDCLGVAQGTATFYYYYWDVDGDGLPGGNYGNKCVAAGQEGNQTASYNGSTVNILTCGSGGVSNGTCADSARDIDDMCNGCGGSSACSENTEALLYDACGVCNGTYNSDIDGDGAVANDSDDCFDDCLGVAQGTATFFYYYWDIDGDGLPGGNYGNKCVAAGQEGNQTASYNGSTVNILTCGSGGVNNGTCADSARDIDDACNGCGGSSACSENTEALLYDACGTCGGPYNTDIDGDGVIAKDSDDCIYDCAGVVNGNAYYDKCGNCVGGNTGQLECTIDCNGVEGGTATYYYYYLDVDGDGLPGGNYGNKCVAAGQEGNQTASYNGSTVNILTCGSTGVSNGTCADSDRDIDDACNGCGGSSACSENTEALLYDACGVCNGTYIADIDGDGTIVFDSDDCFDDCLGVAQGNATFFYYYWDRDGDGLPGGNYGNKCVAAGQEGNQTGSYNGSTVNIVTCGSSGISNGTCADSARDIDDMCNGCGGSSACSENTEALLYDACGVCNGTYIADIDGDGTIVFDSDDCFDDCLGVAQGTAEAYYYYWDRDGDGLPGGNYGNKCVALGQESNQTVSDNGSAVNIVTCGSSGISNGTCSDADRDIDDMCNGCETGACAKNTVELLYDACGECNGTGLSDIDGDGVVAFDSDDCFFDCLGIAQGTAEAYYYYWDRDGDGLPGGNYGNKCVAAGQESNQTVSDNGSTVNIVTCGSSGISNGTCSDADRDIDDMCNGCQTGDCTKNTVELLYDACGECNGTGLLDIDGDGIIALDSDDCFFDCLGVAQGAAEAYYYYWDRDGDGFPGGNYKHICVAEGEEGNQTATDSGGEAVNIITCGANGISNGTCADLDRDIDDTCNGCIGGACTNNTIELLFDDCGYCKNPSKYLLNAGIETSTVIDSVVCVENYPNNACYNIQVESSGGGTDTLGFMDCGGSCFYGNTVVPVGAVGNNLPIFRGAQNIVMYKDLDADGWGSPTDSLEACAAVFDSTYASNNYDYNDSVKCLDNSKDCNACESGQFDSCGVCNGYDLVDTNGDCAFVIFPGDVDNDGTVKVNDLDPIVYYWKNFVSPYRGGTTSFNGETIKGTYDFDTPGFHRNINIQNVDKCLLRADANGDGIIDLSDVMAVYINLGESHGYPNNTGDCANLSSRELDRKIFYDIFISLPEGDLKSSIAEAYNFNVFPEEISISKVFPNPFNASVSIKYAIPDQGVINIKIINILGHEMVNDSFEIYPGDYHYAWDAFSSPSGIYLAQIFFNSKLISNQKMVLLK